MYEFKIAPLVTVDSAGNKTKVIPHKISITREYSENENKNLVLVFPELKDKVEESNARYFKQLIIQRFAEELEKNFDDYVITSQDKNLFNAAIIIGKKYREK